jgi:hypothetical protein
MTRSPFTEGYTDALWSRPNAGDLYPAEQRPKYDDGYRLGDDDRLAGALEPVEASS